MKARRRQWHPRRRPNTGAKGLSSSRTQERVRGLSGVPQSGTSEGPLHNSLDTEEKEGRTSRRCPAQAVSQAQARHTQDRAGLQERQQRLQRGPFPKGVKEQAVVKETRSTGSAHTKGSNRCSHARLAVTELRASLGSSTRVKARQRQRHSSRKGAQHKSEGPLQQRYSWECLKAVGGPEKWHVGRHLKAISTKTSRLRLKRSTPQKVYSTGSFATTGPAPLRPSKAAREAEAQQRGAFTRTLAMMQRKGSAQIKTPSCQLKGEASLAPNKANED